MFCLFATLAAVNLRLWPARHKPLDWDEVDYAQAARLGALTNASGRAELSLVEFGRLALSKLGRISPPAPSVNEAEDAFVLRHFHPPLPVYMWSLVADDDPVAYARRLRVIHLLFLNASIIACAAFLMFAGGRQTWMAVLLSVPLLVTGQQPLATFSSLNFHGPFAVAAVGLLSTILAFVRRPSRGRAALVGALAAICVASLETAVVLLGFAAATTALVHKCSLFRNQKTTLVGAFLFGLLVLWPGAFVTGGPLKSWAMYSYRIAFAGNAEYHGVAPISFWTREIVQNPLLVGLVFLALVLGARWRCSAARAATIPAAAAAGYALAMTPFALAPSYVAPAFMLFWCAAVRVLSRAFSDAETLWKLAVSGLASAAALVALAAALLQVRPTEASALSDARSLASDIAWMKDRLSDDGRPLLVYGGHILRFYSSATRRELESLHLTGDRAHLWVRRDYSYHAVDALVRSQHFSCVGMPKLHASRASVLARLAAWGGQRIELNTFDLSCLSAAGGPVESGELEQCPPGSPSTRAPAATNSRASAGPISER